MKLKVTRSNDVDEVSGAGGGGDSLGPGSTYSLPASLLLPPKAVAGDLNKYSTEELDKVKDKMNAKFLENAKRPGDEGYQYDVQVDFGPPTEDNDWDDSSEGSEEEDHPLP